MTPKKYTELSKKEQGRIRYQRLQARMSDERKRSRRTRPSDICVPRYTDGISGKSKPQTEFVSRFPPKPGKALSFGQFDLILKMLDQAGIK